MSVATQISRITTARNAIRTKFVELGIAAAIADLDALAVAAAAIENQGNVSAEVKEGETYTIPKGYHNGSGTVSGVSGGGNYKTQSKTVTPTKKQQQITPDSGYFALSDVTVSAIPDSYQDVGAVTAVAGDVLTGKTIVDSTGKVVAGAMPSNGAVNKTLTPTTVVYTVPAGYHNGKGTVKIDLETKSVTPTKNAQTITPTGDKVLSSVKVEAIPAKYQDVSGVTATAGDVLTGKTIVGADGSAVTGSMADNGDVSATMDGLTTTSVNVAKGYTSGGTISLTNAIEEALAEV